MTQDSLFKTLDSLAEHVIADARWQNEKDDLGVSVIGMLLYGYALAIGRFTMFMDIEDIDAAVLRCLTKRVGVAAKWAGGLVAEANRSSFNKQNHPAHYELIGVGHQYWLERNPEAIVNNVFANIQSVRRRAAN